MKLENRGSIGVGASFALSAAGLVLVDGVLISIGLAGAILVSLARLLGWWNLRRIEISIEAPSVAQAGDEVRLAVGARNGRRMVDAFRVGISVKGAGGMEAGAVFPWIAAGSTAAGEIRAELPGRGVSEAMVVELTSEFPWGLFRQSRAKVVEHRMRVLPRPVVPVEMLTGSGSLGSGERRSPGAREAVGDLRGLKDYRAGDRVKTVAWPASVKSAARGGPLLVRELDPPGFRPQRVVLVFHSHGSDRALIRPDRFERALSLSWGAVRRLRMRRVPVSWVADFEEWVPREISGRDSLSQLGDALCRARRAPGTEAHELEARLDDFDGEVVVISDMPPDSWEGLISGRKRVRVVDVTEYERGLRLRGGRRA